MRLLVILIVFIFCECAAIDRINRLYPLTVSGSPMCGTVAQDGRPHMRQRDFTSPFSMFPFVAGTSANVDTQLDVPFVNTCNRERASIIVSTFHAYTGKYGG